MFHALRTAGLMLALAGPLTPAVKAAGAPAEDAAAVRQALMAQFDKPEARLEVEPVAVSGDAAVAGWGQGERGGRALLFRQGGHWQIALCAGDALKDAKLMRQAGVKAQDAQVLAKALAAGEARLTPAQRKRLSTFDGLVRMGPGGEHPPAHKH